MRTLQLTRGKEALVDDLDYHYLKQWKWCAISQNNEWRAMRKDSDGKTRYMHQEVANRIGIRSSLVNHRDNNPLNNCRDNLRPATQSQNLHNRGPQKNNTTGVKGVWACKQTGRYAAEITVRGTKHWIGRFDTIKEAEHALTAKRRELLGEYAHRNSYSTRRHGRKKPYTSAGIKRLPCSRCGKPSLHQWQICSDGNLWRPVCKECDILLNELVLEFMRDPECGEKMFRYVASLEVT